MAALLREQSFLILLAVADEERHGYGIIREVVELSGDRVRLGPGTLYGALDRLTEQGLVEATRTEVVSGRVRRYYAISSSGRVTLDQEVSRRRALVGIATTRLRRAGGLTPA